jgi:rod shape-determining protein MreD
VLVLFAASQLLMLAVRLAAGGTYPGASFFMGSVVAAVLWPIVTLVLLAPLRRPAEVDETRPI